MFQADWKPLEKEKWQSVKGSCHSFTVALPGTTTVFKTLLVGYLKKKKKTNLLHRHKDTFIKCVSSDKFV